MIGIVVVSHSPALAAAAVALAGQMITGAAPKVAVAAGAGGGFGTDAVSVARAIEDCAGSDGVLVLMDLGSAVMSAELALELVPVGLRVRLSPAPLVEGLIAAVARAAGGADLDTVAREAEGALAAKQSALDDGSVREPAADPDTDPGHPPGPATNGSGHAVRLLLLNQAGLHARPASTLAAALGGLDVEVAVAFGDRTADALSAIELMALGAGQGAEIEVHASGPDADEALALVTREVLAGFGEM